MQLYLRMRVGFPKPDDLTLAEWDCLVVIEGWLEARRWGGNAEDKR